MQSPVYYYCHAIDTCELKIIRITGHEDTLPSEFFDKMFSQFF